MRQKKKKTKKKKKREKTREAGKQEKCASRGGRSKQGALPIWEG
jgi:hypothetical protein